MKKPIIVGHRGHEHGQENTVASFLEAVEQGAEMLELDVWLTADGVPVVHHDEYLSSGGDKPEQIAEYKAAALEILRLPGGGKIPTLEQVLIELLPQVPLNIELKFFDLNYRPLVKAVVKLLGKAKAERKVLISSFFHQALEVVHWEEPRIATAPVFGLPTGSPHPQDLHKLSKLEGWPGEIGFHRPAAVVDYLMLDEGLVEEFRSADLALLAYTVDAPEEMRRMVNLGVEAIITKRPAVLRQVLEEYELA